MATTMKPSSFFLEAGEVKHIAEKVHHAIFPNADFVIRLLKERGEVGYLFARFAHSVLLEDFDVRDAFKVFLVVG
jgi:hypothetical protein